MGKSVASLPDSAVDLIRSGAEGHMVTLNPDGSLQISLVWVAATADELRVASLTPRQKLRNIRRDDRVAISFQSPLRDAPGENGSVGGMRYYLVIKGRAAIEDGGAPELLRELAATYLGPGVKFPRGDNPPEGWVVRIAVERWHGYGPWGDGP
jgi:PPOX class probable F420-dependent enzyme